MIRSLLLPILDEQQILKYQDRLHSASTEIASFIQSRKSEVRLLADLPTLQSMHWPEIEPLLASRLTSEHKDFEKFVLGLPSSHYYTTATGNPFLEDLSSFDDTSPDAELKSIAQRDYWRITVGHNTQHQQVDYVSNPMISYTTGIKQVLVTSSIHRQGEVVGLIAGSISWEKITELIDKIQTNYPKSPSRFMLVSKDGNYWYHWNPDKVIQVIRDKQGNIVKNKINEASVTLHNILAEQGDELKSLGRNMVAGKTGQQTIRIDGNTQTVFFGPIPNTNYSLAQVIDQADFSETKRQFSVFLLVAFIASLMVYLFLVYLIPKSDDDDCRKR